MPLLNTLDNVLGFWVWHDDQKMFFLWWRYLSHDSIFDKSNATWFLPMLIGIADYSELRTQEKRSLYVDN